VKISTPLLSRLNHDKNPHWGRAFDLALETLNTGLEAKQIWNVEVGNAKFTLSNGIDRALGSLCDRYRSSRGNEYRYESWQDDFSGYCAFNQAAGRGRRLTKVFGFTPSNPVIADYITALAEVADIWVLIQSLKPFIQKGRRPSQNKTEAQIADELVNTGVCAICGNRQKFGDEDKMVPHGYKMSDYNHSGYRIGSCFGVGYKPYELSNEANVAFKPVLDAQLKNYRSALKTLKSGAVETLTVYEEKFVGGKREKVPVILKKGTPEFDRELKSGIARTESFIRYTKSDIRMNDAKIKGWKLQPLLYGRKKV
jgi:hypothetical protein